MAANYEYIMSLSDKMSAPLKKISGVSHDAVGSFIEMKDKQDALRRTTADFGNSIFNLKKKIDLLQQEKELIDPKNIKDIQKYNREIGSLSKQIDKLENTDGQSKFKQATNDAFGQLPPFLTNPAVMVTAAVGGAGKMAVAWEEGMAKINATAQLPQEELNKLSSTIKKLGMDVGTDLSNVPVAYEQIISQTGDVALSSSILESALKGAKAGFTDVSVVSGALAQTLSAVGAENTNANEVINTLFAAKRVGAGEFTDFAQYVPTLVSAAQGVGTAWQDAAGMFSYMTGKGQSAANAATLIQNAFSALGKGDVQKKLADAGVEVFDAEGNIKNIEDIMAAMNAATAGMSNEEASGWLESVGLKDMQAKQAFLTLSADVDKLRTTMSAVREPAGELEAALRLTQNPMNSLKMAMSKIQGIAITFGGTISAMITPALNIAMPIMDVFAWTVEKLAMSLSWVINMIQQGNPWVITAAAVIGYFTIAMNANRIAAAAMRVATWWNTKANIQATIVGKAKAIADGLQTGVTWAMVAAQWAWNTALAANPLVWIIAGIAALVGAVVLCWQKFEGFRKTIYGMWEVFKVFGHMLKELVIGRLIDLLKGIGKIGKAIGLAFSGKFKQAAATANDGVLDMSGVNATKRAMEHGKGIGEAWKKGQEKGAASFKASEDKRAKKKQEKEDANQQDVQVEATPLTPDNMPKVPEIVNQKQTLKVDTKVDQAQKKGDELNTASQDYKDVAAKFGPSKTQQKLTIAGQAGTAGKDAKDGTVKVDQDTEKKVTTLDVVKSINSTVAKIAASVAIVATLGGAATAHDNPAAVHTQAKEKVETITNTHQFDHLKEVDTFESEKDVVNNTTNNRVEHILDKTNPIMPPAQPKKAGQSVTVRIENINVYTSADNVNETAQDLAEAIRRELLDILDD